MAKWPLAVTKCHLLIMEWPLLAMAALFSSIQCALLAIERHFPSGYNDLLDKKSTPPRAGADWCLTRTGCLFARVQEVPPLPSFYFPVESFDWALPIEIAPHQMGVHLSWQGLNRLGDGTPISVSLTLKQVQKSLAGPACLTKC